MADKDDIREGKDFGLGIPQKNQAFYLKGAGAVDWGMQNRLARIFNPASGRTVMLAFDHGYFQGPTTGLERIDLNIVPLIPYADVLMCTRGALRSVIPPSATNAVELRCSGGQSILTELSRELIAVDIEDAIRINAAALTTQIYIGAEYEHQSIKNLVQLIDTGNKYGIPTMAVTGVGAEMKRDERYFLLATRIAAELGARTWEKGGRGGPGGASFPGDPAGRGAHPGRVPRPPRRSRRLLGRCAVRPRRARPAGQGHVDGCLAQWPLRRGDELPRRDRAFRAAFARGLGHGLFDR